MMGMTRSTNRLTAGVLIAFLAVAVSLTYWSVFAADGLLGRADNPRAVEFEQMLRRGAMYDRAGKLLAQTVDAGRSASGKQLARRVYPEPSTLTVTGYYSLTQGGKLVHGGVEEAFDATLRGDDTLTPGERIGDDLLHTPRAGNDVRLTLDLSLQNAAAGALRPYSGAIIAVDIPTGAIRAMVSAPSYDPNTGEGNLSAAQLLADPSALLFNRAIQGVYQPGGALETVVLSALLTDRVTLDSPLPIPTAPLQIGKFILDCATALPGTATLQLAYADACPAAFASAAYDHRDSLQAAIEAFGLLKPPSLAHFKTQTGSLPLPLNALPATHDELGVQGVGQGLLTVTPLQMVAVVAAIANHGNAVPMTLVDATRAPGMTTWQPISQPADQPAIISSTIASSLRLALRAAVTDGAAHIADQPDMTVYGHASYALSGLGSDPRTNGLSWFIGFVDTPNGSTTAIVVVVENTRNPTLAAQIGGTVLYAASRMAK